MRLFIAVDMDSFSGYFKGIQMGIRGAIAKYAGSFHITLKFLGEIDSDKIESIKDALKKVNFSAFKFRIGGIGAFPNPNYVRVVWVGATSEKKKLRELQTKIDSVLYDIGFKRDSDFVPHVTLARIKNVKNKKEFSDSISSLQTEEKEILCSRFHLMKSTLTKAGPVYERIASFDSNDH